MIRALIFDWGDTVMRTFPQYPGPMADWPRVAAVPDVVEVLRALGTRYRLALATNALDSDRALVIRALARVGLGDCFHAVYTARELRARKPQPQFFATILRDLGLAPAEAVMVGDDYEQDVRGAKEAGLWTVWFNPAGAGPARGQRRDDAEIAGMAEMPEAVASLERRAQSLA